MNCILKFLVVIFQETLSLNKYWMPSIGGLLYFEILDHTIKAMTIVRKLGTSHTPIWQSW
jgi:hypothetical protein